MRCDSVFVLQAAPAGPYFRLPRFSTVMVVVFGIAVMSLETLTVPSNMALNIALPSLMAALNVSQGTIQWLVTGYMLVIGICT